MSDSHYMKMKNKIELASLEEDLKLLKKDPEQYKKCKRMQISSCKKRIAQLRKLKSSDARAEIEELEADLDQMNQSVDLRPESLEHLIKQLKGIRMVEESKLEEEKKRAERYDSMKKLNRLFVEGFISFLQGMELGFNMDENDGEIEASELRQFINRNLYKRIDEDSDSDEDVPGHHTAFRDETGFFAGLKRMLDDDDDDDEEANFFDILKLLGGLKGDIKKLLPGMDGCSDEQDTFNKKINQMKKCRNVPQRQRAMFYFKTAYDNFFKAFDEIFDVHQSNNVSILDVTSILEWYAIYFKDSECIIAAACDKFTMTAKYETTFYKTVSFDSFMEGLSLILKDFYNKELGSDSSDSDSSD